MTVRHLLGGVAFAATSLLFVAGGASAQTPLAPGTFVPAPTDPVASLTAGSTLLSQLTSGFNITNPGTTPQTISGNLLSSVYRNTGGTLDFFYQITTNGASNSNIGAFSVTSFAGTTTSVAQTTADIDAGGPFVAGAVASSFISRENTGEGLTFNFLSGIGTNSSSYAQFVRTSATNFTTQGQAAVLGSGVSANLNSNVIAATPPSQAPEPGSLALAATGLMGAMGMVIRRRRSAK